MKKIPIIFFLILFLAFILRLWRVNELFYFNMDEALLAFRGWGIFELKRFFIIGGISPLGFHLPPYFYWFSALFLPILNFNPVIWGYLAALIALITIAGLFFLSRKISDEKTALITVFLYGTSLMAVFFDRHYWPLVFNPLLAVLTLWLLISKFSYRWFFLALVLVFAVTADPSNLPLLILVIYNLFKNKTDRVNKINKIIFSVTFLVLFFLPLFAFDLRHQGSNFQGINLFVKKIQGREIKKKSFINALLLPARSLSQFWYSGQTNVGYFHTYCEKYSIPRQISQNILLQRVAFILLIGYYFKKKNSVIVGEKYIAQLLLIYSLGVLFYGGFLGRPLFDHYLAGLLPVFAFITSKFLAKFWPLSSLILIFFFYSNIKQFVKSNNPYGLRISREAIDWTIKVLNGEEFALDTISKCFRYNGLRYLYEIKGPPTASNIDPDFFWLYRKQPTEILPEKITVFSDKAWQTDLPIIQQKQWGDWQVSILDNSKKTYKIEGL